MAQDYSKMTKDELVTEIKRLKPKKYGLMWEHKDEDVVEECKTKLPVLNEVAKRAIKKAPGDPTNIIIEGDNYHALSVLNYTHQGKIDVIYIDPPYNTGASDWKYNNNYVDINDTFRHSKWISMMEHRLKISKGLLAKNGVLICAIDDNEIATLSLLLAEIFPEKIQNTVVIANNPHGVARSGFSRTHEYALFIINPGEVINKKAAPEDIRNINLRRSGNNSLRKDSPTMFYPILVDKKRLTVIGVGDVPPVSFHPQKQTIDKKSHYEVWPIDNNGIEKNWYYSLKRVKEKGEQELNCRLTKSGEVHIHFYHSNNAEQTYKSVWIGSEYDSGAYGATLVKNLTKENFPFPKSIHTVYDCIKAVIKTKDAVVLDFFAGSGTTGHAVMKLNQEDGGKRQFILSTNNEKKIAEKVTYPRIKKVITGYANEKGIPANVRYFKTDFINKTASRDEQKMRITERCTEMLCLREGIFTEVTDKKSYKIFKDGERVLAVYYAVSHKDLPKLKKELDKIKGDKALYCFTLDAGELDAREFTDWGNVRLEPIPQKILDIYKEIHEY